MRNTDFQFGHNVQDNADPWGQKTVPEQNIASRSAVNVQPKAEADSGPISGLVAGGYFGYIEDALETDAFLKMVWLRLNSFKEEIRTMLPAAGNTEKAPKKTSGRSNGLPFLTNEHLSKQPKEAKILSVRVVTKEWNGKSSQAVSLRLAMEGHQFMWDLKLSNPNLATLQQQFGLEENEYVDKKILLYLEQDEHSLQYWPRVDFPKPESKKK